jgi:hypothetical protein
LEGLRSTVFRRLRMDSSSAVRGPYIDVRGG